MARRTAPSLPGAVAIRCRMAGGREILGHPVCVAPIAFEERPLECVDVSAPATGAFPTGHEPVSSDGIQSDNVRHLGPGRPSNPRIIAPLS